MLTRRAREAGRKCVSSQIHNLKTGEKIQCKTLLGIELIMYTLVYIKVSWWKC